MARFYYAVRAGRQPGVYDSWGQCEAQVKGFSGARFAKFGSLAEARRFIESEDALKAEIVGERVSVDTEKLDDNEITRNSEVKKRSHIEIINDDTSSIKKTKNTAPEESTGCTVTTKISTNFFGEYFPRQPPKTIIYTDGACSGNGTLTANAGYGIHFPTHPHLSRAGRVKSQPATNQRAELLAIYGALTTAEDARVPEPLEIRTDSKYCIHGLTQWFGNWERKGLDNLIVKNIDLFKSIVEKARKFSDPIYLVPQ